LPALSGLGLAACEQGRKVRYVTCGQLVNELVEAADERVLSRVVAHYGRLIFFCLMGYVQIDPRGAELLVQIITEREERASIGLASNLPFSEWGAVVPDPRLVAAIVDRITYNAHSLETGTESYRCAPQIPPHDANERDNVTSSSFRAPTPRMAVTPTDATDDAGDRDRLTN
jgi:DNA replication protein DnaC